LSELRNNIRKLIRHKEASAVIETFYGQYANAQQRKALLAEFYGPEFTLFAKKSKDAEIHTIDELLEKHPEKKDGVLRYMAETLGGCTDKGTVGNSIIHKALFEYFSRADEKGIQVNDLFEFGIHDDGQQKCDVFVASFSWKDVRLDDFWVDSLLIRWRFCSFFYRI
jgi:hypothetical protein